MGIYIYTMRKDSIIVDGIDIGRFAYAYKEGWRASESRHTKRLHTMAENARWDLPKVTYVVLADSFNKASEYELPIYKISDTTSYSVEEPKLWDNDTNRFEPQIIGYLTKVGRKFSVKMS